jgi:hypothetical protein
MTSLAVAAPSTFNAIPATSSVSAGAETATDHLALSRLPALADGYALELEGPRHGSLFCLIGFHRWQTVALSFPVAGRRLGVSFCRHCQAIHRS